MLSSSFFVVSLLWFLINSGCTDGFANIAKTVIVDQSGRGDFTTVQAAIDSVPDGNKDWIRIHINRGTYREKVIVPFAKEYILLEGEGPGLTLIEWGDYTDVYLLNSSVILPQDATSSATFTLLAANFKAVGIQFANTYNLYGSKNPRKVAVAASIGADKASFYYCGFKGVQDTLCDFVGRHYFKSCWIEGAVDYIFGFARSIYEHCVLSTIPADNRGTPGYITAHGAVDPANVGGFVFKYCTVVGKGKAYLGRAWRRYATVIFYKTYMSKVVVPLGWDIWNQQGHESETTYAEDGCLGPGSTGKRVTWEKKLSPSQLSKYVSKKFVDNEGWLGQQP